MKRQGQREVGLQADRIGMRWTPTLSVLFGVMPENPALRTAILGTVKSAYQAGVQLLAGTDALNPDDGYGLALNVELQRFAEAGIPPLEVLRIATEHSAAMMGAGNLLGSLEPGKLGDIVLLDGNPLDDISNTLTVWKVVLSGRVFEERQPPTGNGGEGVHDPNDLHTAH
jgi:imidazolonepropionase-like amidohydrolase